MSGLNWPGSQGGGAHNVLGDLFRDALAPDYHPPARPPDGPGRPAPRWRLVGLVTLLVAGLLLAVAYRQVVAEQPTRSQVRADLAEQIHHRQAETEALQEQAERLRDQVGQLRDRELGDPAAVRQLREMEAATGLRRVHGDGLVVRVADGPAGVDPVTGEPEIDPQSRVFYRDLQQVTNAMWAAGAEAVAVNGRRLTTASAIRSAGGAILVDRAPVAGPYEVVAIGPAELPERFAASAAAALLAALASEYGIEYETRPAQDLTLPAAVPPELRYAVPVEDE